jgi:hypothetical protein
MTFNRDTRLENTVGELFEFPLMDALIGRQYSRFLEVKFVLIHFSF